MSQENVGHSPEKTSPHSTSLPDVEEVQRPSLPIPTEKESEENEKQRKVDYKKFCEDMKKELDKYVVSPSEDSSRKQKLLKQFLADIQARLKPSDTSKREDSKFKAEKFIRLLKSGRECNIEGCLNGILHVDFHDSHYEVLNYAVERICDGETLLHIALKFENTNTFAEKYMALCPNVLLKKREKSGFKGQTPLHVAIVKGKIMIVKKILETAKEEGTLSKLLTTQSSGDEFKDTVLLGELPLSVAALACKDKKFEIMKTLLDKNAEISETNSDQDTVFHSLIKYADIYPEKISYIQASFGFLWGHVCNPVKYYEKNPERNQTESKLNTEPPKSILFMKNNDGLTPLHLAAKLGVSQIFDVIVNTEDVYQFMNRKDGLFDIRVHDVTEFDRLIAYKENSEHERSKKLTILERLFGSKCSHQEAFQILNQDLVLFILKKKWNAYWWPLLLWMFMHFIFMILFTASTIIKAELLFCSQNNQTVCDTTEVFYAVIVMDAVFGILYLVFAVLCAMRLIDRFKIERDWGFIWHNLDYVLCLLVVSVCVLIESVLIPLKIHWDFHVVLALTCGWYFMIYFSPFYKTFVSFTYMLQKGFKEDFLPFCVVFLCLFISFTGIMHILFLGIDEEEDDNSFGTIQTSLLAMFNLGVGLNNLDGLDKTRIPWLAYTSFVMFTVLSFIHLLNALIAVMSQTFSDVHAEKHNYLKYNRLRMIELFEDIVLVQAFIKHIRPSFLKKAKHWRTIEIEEYDEDIFDDKSHKNNENSKEKHKRKKNDNRRFYSEVRLLDDPNDDVDEKEEKRKGHKHKFKNIFERLKRSAHEKVNTQHGSCKCNPVSEITYTQILNSKASQFPNIEMENKATQFPELDMNTKASQFPQVTDIEMNSKASQFPQLPDIEKNSKASQFPQLPDIELNSKASQFP